MGNSYAKRGFLCLKSVRTSGNRSFVIVVKYGIGLSVFGHVKS